MATNVVLLCQDVNERPPGMGSRRSSLRLHGIRVMHPLVCSAKTTNTTLLRIAGCGAFVEAEDVEDSVASERASAGGTPAKAESSARAVSPLTKSENDAFSFREI